MSEYLIQNYCKFFRLTANATWIWILICTSTHAASSESFVTDHGEVRLISAVNAVGGKKKHLFGLHFKMKPGWKIYWRSPGSSGFPPKLNWDGSENIESINISWPYPERFSVLGVQTLGYKNEVVFPLTLHIEEAKRKVSLRAIVSYLTCNHICIPYEAKLLLSVPIGKESPAYEAQIINHYLKLVPVDGPTNGMSILLAETHKSKKQEVLSIALRSQKRISNPEIFIESDTEFRFGKIKRVNYRDSNTAVYDLELFPPLGIPEDNRGLSGELLQVTVVDDGLAFEQKIRVPDRPAFVTNELTPKTIKTSWFELFSIIGIAVLGGFILNFMPCVLPVISLKLLSVINYSGVEKNRVRQGFLATSAGIFASFFVLATGAVIMKVTGQEVGWGVQFQNPIFLVVLASLTILFAANLWGFFEFRTPNIISKVAQKIFLDEGKTGHFFAGALTTVMATPCSAPFLGTAIGFSLARGPIEIYAIFAALAFGLSVPFLVIAAFPKFVNILPRPGAWMSHLRKFLGLALIVTSMWLMSVLVTIVGMNAVYGVVIGISFIFVSLYFSQFNWIITGTTIGLAIVCILTSLIIFQETKEKLVDQKSIYWQKFDPEKIESYVDDGKIVFIDITADWCITCLFNKKMVLMNDDIVQKLNSDDVVAMQGNWTLPNPIIMKFLKQFNRFGIPFNIVFRKQNRKGLILPEVLTNEIVKKSLRQSRSVLKNK